MTSGPFDISGDLPVPFAAPVGPPASLAHVSQALTFWERQRDAEREAMDWLREAVDTARQDGATLAEIAAELGRTRQYVQKLLRGAVEADEREAYLARQSANAPGGSRNGPTPQCAGCKRFLKASATVCPSCGYAGHGGYVGVPATTSYLERWR